MRSIFLFFISLIPALSNGQQTPPPPEPLEYNVDLPTGDQKQPVYFTKDMTINVGTTQIGFYGFFKADYLGQTRIAGTTADVRLSNVPLNTNLADKKMESLLDARTSRLGFKVEDSVHGVKMKGAVEGDFFTTIDGTAIVSNSRLFRLRLAYATAELPSHFFFLTGQYYTLPMHYPEIDMPTRVNIVYYPAGALNSRQPQFRLGYKQYFSENQLLQYEANAEFQGYNTTGFVTPKGGDTAQGAEQKWPLFTAKVSWLSEMFKWNIALSGTEAYAIINSQGTRLHTPVWGVTSTAAFYWKNLILWATGHHYLGLTGLSSGYLNQLALINHDTELKALKANGGTVALRYDFLKKQLWTDVMYGVEKGSEIRGSPLFSGSATKQIEDFRINLIGAFWKHWQVGLEYERTYVIAYDGTTGLDNMVHLAVWYIFGQP